MTAFGTTFQTFQAIGVREDLENTIYSISPTDTPFISNGGRGDAKATLHEWQTDSLATVDTGNAQIQGDDITAIPAATPSVRVGNYTQISRKLVLVAGTLDAVDKAGRQSELAYQLAKKSKELKRDMEAIALHNIAGSAGNATTAATMATMGAWLKSNISYYTTDGGNPAYTSGVPAAARTDGTTRAFSETLFKAVLQSVWTSGGSLRMAMAGPANKQNLSQMAGIATHTYNFSGDNQMTIVGAADVYVSDFGVLSIVPNRFQRDRDVWVLDPEYYSIAYLRSFRTEKLAKTGDAEKRMLLVEWTLKVHNEAAHGLVADLNTTLQT